MNTKTVSKRCSKIIGIFLAILLAVSNCAYIPLAGADDAAGKILNLSSVSNSPDRVKLSWDNDSKAAGGCTIERSEDGVNFTKIAATADNQASYQDTKNLKPGTVYYYRVKTNTVDGPPVYSQTTVSTPTSPGIKEEMTVWEKVGNTFRTEIKTITTEKVTELSKTYSFASPVVSKSEGNYDLIEVPGAMLSSIDSNKPIMPFKSVNILIPSGFDVAGVEVVPGEAIPLKGDYSIKPAPDLAGGGPVTLSPDKRIYDSDNAYPFEPAGDVSIQNFKGFNIAVTTIYPLEYHPRSKKVYYYPDMQVKLSLIPGGAPAALSGGEPKSLSTPSFAKDKENVSSLVDNPEVIDTYGN